MRRPRPVLSSVLVTAAALVASLVAVPSASADTSHDPFGKVQRVSRSAGEITRLLRREVGKTWGGKSIHEVSKRDVVELVSAIEQRGAPVAANKALKSIKTFLRWCVGRAVLDQSQAAGPIP